MNDNQSTELIILRKMDPAASQRILNYLLRELTARNLLHSSEQFTLSETPEAVPEER